MASDSINTALRQNILAAVQKLGDRDTADGAANELETLAVGLSSEQFAVLLHTLTESLGNQHYARHTFTRRYILQIYHCGAIASTAPFTFDFPVVFHMQARDGEVIAQVLGPRRPYDQVVFDREVVQTHEFNTVYREVQELREGEVETAQRGRRGITIRRTRRMMNQGEVVKEHSRELRYPPTTEILKRGVGEDGRAAQHTRKPPLRDPAPHLRLTQ